MPQIADPSPDPSPPCNTGHHAKATVTFQLPAQSSSVGLARDGARRFLERWGIGGDACDDAVLVLSELATNAVQHGTPDGRPFEVVLSLGEVLRIEISDTDSTGKPTPSFPDVDAEQGRGLFLAQWLSTLWGTQSHPRLGKTVWVEFKLPD